MKATLVSLSLFLRKGFSFVVGIGTYYYFYYLSDSLFVLSSLAAPSLSLSLHLTPSRAERSSFALLTTHSFFQRVE